MYKKNTFENTSLDGLFFMGTGPHGLPPYEPLGFAGPLCLGRNQLTGAMPFFHILCVIFMMFCVF